MSALTRCESTRYVLNPQLNPKTFALYYFYYIRTFVRACITCVRAVPACVHVTAVMGEAFVVGMCVGQKRPSSEAKET